MSFSLARNEPCRPLGFPPTWVMSAGACDDFIGCPDGRISLCDPGTSRGRIGNRHINCCHPGAQSHAADAAAPRPKEKRRLESSAHHPGGLPCRLVRGQRGVGSTSHLKSGLRGPRAARPPSVSRRRIRAASGGAEARFVGQIALIRIRHIMEHFPTVAATLGDAILDRGPAEANSRVIGAHLDVRDRASRGDHRGPSARMGCFAGLRRTRGLRERGSHSHRGNDQCLLSASSGYAGSTWTVLSIQRWQRQEGGVFATKVLAGPTPLAHGLATVETFSDLGTMADAHDPEIRRALAHGLHRIVVTCEALAASTSIRSQLPASAQGSLWPRPHSKLFDFAASSSGAEWIDEIALFARQRMKPVGRRVIGHGDWRQEHARFAGNQLVVAFDWDSLCCELEPVLLGSVTHGFCADWSDTSHRQAPTLAEARAFVADYEDARGASFSPDERRLCSASFGYACAYTARCSHCGGSDDREKFGTFQNLVWAEGTNLLD